MTPLQTDLISVIVPIYKMEAYLDLCVESILGQTYKNLEIILVDDQSPDNCWKMMQGYAARDKRVKIYKKPENGGLSDARNYGMERMSGNYVAFVDADDHIDPTLMEKMHTKAVQEDADIVLCGYDRFEEDNGPTAPMRKDIQQAMRTLAQRTHSAQEVYPIFFELGMTVWRGLFRADLINKYKEPFPKGLHYEDEYWHTFYRLRAQRLAAVDEALYHYRTRANSITGGMKYAPEVLEVFDRVEKTNAQELKNPQFAQAYFTHKARALLPKLPWMITHMPPAQQGPLIARLRHSVQELMAMKLPLNKKERQALEWLHSADLPLFAFRLRLLQLRKKLSLWLKAIIQLNLGSRNERYIKLAGHTLRLP